MNLKKQTVLPEGTPITYCPKKWAQGAERGGITRPHASGGKRYGRAAIEKAKGAAMLVRAMTPPTVVYDVQADAEVLDVQVDREWNALLAALGCTV
jgi:hypothetical protein